MMPDIKRCERCYRPISWVDRADWYSHIRIKYCDECRPIVEREKTAARLKRFRERQKEAAKIRDQRLKELELENLAPGIYTLEVTYKGQVYTYTIVKR